MPIRHGQTTARGPHTAHWAFWSGPPNNDTGYGIDQCQVFCFMDYNESTVISKLKCTCYLILYSCTFYLNVFFQNSSDHYWTSPPIKFSTTFWAATQNVRPPLRSWRLHIHSQTVESQPLQYGSPALCSISTKNRSQLSEQAIKRIEDKVSYTRGSTGENRQRVRVIEAWCCLLSEPSERMDGPATQREDW